MKHFTFYILSGMLVLHLMTDSQVVCGQMRKHWLTDMIHQRILPNRIENRKVDDPIYETGDTLFLFYDWTDSLQTYYDYDSTYSYRTVLWKIRELTQEEKAQDAPPEYDGWLESNKWLEFALCGIHGRKPEIWTFDDLRGIVLTSRKEFLDFYQREYVRKKGKYKENGKESRMLLSTYDFGNYFAYIYMIVPQSDGKFRVYAIRVEGYSLL